MTSLWVWSIGCGIAVLVSGIGASLPVENGKLEKKLEKNGSLFEIIAS